jgi:serine/threonine protein kinase
MPMQPTRLGRFVLIREIGSGGMGTVYMAYDDHLDRKVALKILSNAKPRGRRRRTQILREARAAARVAHPNVISIYEVGEADGLIYIAMEYVDGGTLLQWQRRGGHTWQEILAMYLQAGEGLLAAQDAGVVHRDFKPDEVTQCRRRRKKWYAGGVRTCCGWPELVPAVPHLLGQPAIVRTASGQSTDC